MKGSSLRTVTTKWKRWVQLRRRVQKLFYGLMFPGRKPVQRTLQLSKSRRENWLRKSSSRKMQSNDQESRITRRGEPLARKLHLSRHLAAKHK